MVRTTCMQFCLVSLLLQEYLIPAIKHLQIPGSTGLADRMPNPPPSEWLNAQTVWAFQRKSFLCVNQLLELDFLLGSCTQL